MDNFKRNFLKQIIIALSIVIIGWSFYDFTLRERIVGENYYYAGNKYFEDGMYQDALSSYQDAVINNPKFIQAKRGIARSLMQLERNKEALTKFDEVIKQDPNFATSFANRGILHDRMQAYNNAIKDYEKALQLDPGLAKGPNWITRFLRNQSEKPPSILERLQYLKKELNKPKDFQILQIKEKDDEQRPYKR